MKCHYEILNINQDVDDNAIKVAYKRMALKWHPDKNPNDIDEAKEQFQLIQQAYEVLSDPQERAWYDKHREQILRGHHSDFKDESLNVYEYFTVSCYKGFTDHVDSFYSVYSHVFQKLATEDMEFFNSRDEYNAIPMFGTANSSYEEVVAPFYAFWQSYCTRKSYSWLCPHDITQIKDRRILREIEKEMKKIAQKARKARNEEVRALVTFVRKRDKRVLEYRKLLEERAEANRLKQQQKRLEQMQQNKANVEAMKNERTFFNTESHEAELRQIEDQYASSNDTDNCSGIEEVSSSEEFSNMDNSRFVDSFYCVACNKSFKSTSAFRNHESSKRHKFNIEKIKQEVHTDETIYQQISTNKSPEPALPKDFNDKIDGININPQIINLKKIVNVPLVLPSSSEDEPDIIKPSIEDWTDDNKKQKSRQKNKRNLKTSNKNKTNIPNLTGNIDIDHICVTCSQKFQSKNKLFTHLKLENHGVYIPKEKLKRGQKS